MDISLLVYDLWIDQQETLVFSMRYHGNATLHLAMEVCRGYIYTYIYIYMCVCVCVCVCVRERERERERERVGRPGFCSLERYFYLPVFNTDCGAQLTSCAVGIGDSWEMENESGRSLLSCAEVQNMFNYDHTSAVFVHVAVLNRGQEISQY
jgi:hypothetical protein